MVSDHLRRNTGFAACQRPVSMKVSMLDHISVAACNPRIIETAGCQPKIAQKVECLSHRDGIRIFGSLSPLAP